MNDIKKPSRNLKYRNVTTRSVPTLRINDSIPVSKKLAISHTKDIFKRVEDFENENYLKDSEDDDSIDSVIKNKKQVVTSIKQKDYDYYGRPGSKSREFHNVKTLKIKKIFPIIFISLFFLFVLTILLTFVFNSAKLTISSKKIQQEVNQEVTLFNSMEKSDYEIVEIKKEALKDVERSEVKKIVSKASGEIFIYNNFNENSQKLVKNTRFESENGKIFRTVDSVTVPPKPGFVKVKVTADSVGESYNIRAGKFTIPGFKGSSRYLGFYGESKIDISGGSNSQKSYISKSDLENSKMSMQAELRDLIIKDAKSVSKKDYINAEGLLSFYYENNTSILESDDQQKLKVLAIGKVFLIKKDKLTKLLASKVFTEYGQEEIYLNKDNFTFSYAQATTTDAKEKDESSINIKVSGFFDGYFQTDKESLVKKLVNKENTQQNFSSLLSEFKSVKSANAKIFPPWINTFPKNYKKIQIIEN
jgi:hypothetical protein